MELTRKQSEGLKIAIERYLHGEKYTVIGGFAGTGKSTLIKFIISALSSHGVDPDHDVVYAAYTGKAAQVLVEKGNKNAKTLHKLLYKAIPLPNGSYRFVPADTIEAKVVVIDECSMVPESMIKQLARYPKVYYLFTGDPGQLPPIEREEDNGLLYNPHVFLDEVMRQAQESGIIRLSMKIRNQENFHNFCSNEAIVLSCDKPTDNMLSWPDQILCATNRTRTELNQRCRKLLGHTGIIDEDEKLICLRNYWKIAGSEGNPLTNGVIGHLDNCKLGHVSYPLALGVPSINTITGQFITELNEDFRTLTMDKKLLVTGEDSLTGPQKYSLVKKGIQAPLEFTYGYAITTWKAQGSEWESVLGIEERHPFDRDEHIRYLYTLVTRASKKLMLLTK